MGFCTRLILLHSGENRGKKRILGQCAGIMQTVLHLTPPLADVRNIEKSKDSGTMCWYHANSSPPYPPLQMSGSCPKTEKASRNRKILSKTKKNLEKSKKTKKTKDSGTMCWYHVNILLARLVFFWFFSISRGFFRFWTKPFDFSMFFLILDGFFRILNVFLILDTFF